MIISLHHHRLALNTSYYPSLVHSDFIWEASDLRLREVEQSVNVCNYWSCR